MTIVVLGGGINEKGEISKQTKKRLYKVREIFESGEEKPDILLCGKYSFLYPEEKTPPFTEARAMKDYLLLQNVPEEKIYLEEKSRDTISNAYYAKTEHFIPQRKKAGIVVSSDYHLPRVKYIFKKVFGPDYDLRFEGIPSPFSQEEKEKLKKRQKLLIEKIEKMTEEMQPGDHEFLKNIFFEDDYYKEERPSWIIEKLTKGN